jgi:hypothetical protein
MGRGTKALSSWFQGCCVAVAATPVGAAAALTARLWLYDNRVELLKYSCRREHHRWPKWSFINRTPV